MKYEPTYLEMFLTKLALSFAANPSISQSADSLPLDGGSGVLVAGVTSGNGGVLVFSGNHGNMQKTNIIKRLIENALSLKNSRITDIPVVSNTLESVYVKE